MGDLAAQMGAPILENEQFELANPDTRLGDNIAIVAGAAPPAHFSQR